MTLAGAITVSSERIKSSNSLFIIEIILNYELILLLESIKNIVIDLEL